MWFGSADQGRSALPANGNNLVFAGRVAAVYGQTAPTLEVFARVEEVAGVEGAFDLGVEIAEGRGGGYFPPRLFGEANAVFAANDAAHL